jgi:hypothetical protein
VKTLMAILFLTLLGTVAHAAPDSDPLKFAYEHCDLTDRSDDCRTFVTTDPSAQVMNHYSLAVRICSKKYVDNSSGRSNCLVKAAKEMNDSDLTKDVVNCYNARTFWWDEEKNKNWAEKANCQSDVFAKKAAVAGPPSGGTAHGHSAGTRP